MQKKVENKTRICDVTMLFANNFCCRINHNNGNSVGNNFSFSIKTRNGIESGSGVASSFFKYKTNNSDKRTTTSQNN